MAKNTSKIKNKKNADYKLATEQFVTLNKEFYNDFFVDFYEIKLANLLGIIASTKDFTQILSSSKLEVGKAELHFEQVHDSEKKMQQFAKLELAMTYYHCLETFIRIFIAHAKISQCPWLEFSRLNLKTYKNWLKKLSNNEFESLNDKLSIDETFLWVFTGNTKLEEEMTQNDLEGLKEWVRWSANELLETFDYNSFKHGLAIYVKPRGFRIGEKTDRYKLEKQGDALRFITQNEKENRYVWSKETLWISYDSRSAIIWTVNSLIKCIHSVGKLFHLREPILSIWLPNHEWSPDFLLKKNDVNELGLSVKGFKQELRYYK